MFDAVASMVGNSCRIWVASHEGVPVASIITLVYGSHATYWHGYSNKALAAPLQANNLLQRFAIEDACAAGCRWYGMGESGGVGSLEKFKQSLGATPRRAVEYRIERLPITSLEKVKRRVEAAVARLLSVRAAGRPSPRRSTRSQPSRP